MWFSSEDPAEANLQNAIERLRDPSHTRMLSALELDACACRAGFCDLEHSTWDKNREFDEWMAIVNDPERLSERWQTPAARPEWACA
jgi:hypothetical protein